MALYKKNYPVDTRVTFIKTGGPLDGQHGTILGVVVDNWLDDYIVMYDVPVNGQKAILITEACLEVTQ